MRDREALGTVRGDEDRHRDRALRQVTVRGDHLDDRAVDDHPLTFEQAAHLRDVRARLGPRHRGLAERHPPGEAGADRDHHPARRQGLERGDRARLGQRVPQPRDQHRGAEADPLGVLRDLRERDPHVGIERRRVVEPDALVPELLGQPGVLHHVGSRRERARDLKRRHCSSGQS